MKHLKLLFILTLVTVMVASVATAGRADGVRADQQQTVRPGQVINEEGRSNATGNFRFDRFATSEMVKPALRLPVDKASAKTQFAVGLSGTYSIPGDFASISDAVAVLNFVGLSGNTTFELANTSYTELAPITFGAYTGAATYTLTIQPAAATDVLVNFISSATEGKGFAFDGASNVTIDGLNTGGAALELNWRDSDPFPAGDPLASTIYITGASEDISILNSTVNGNLDGTFAAQTDGRAAIFIFRGDADLDPNDGITIDGNTIINGTYGIKILAEDANGDYFENTNITISNNLFGGAYGGKLVQGILSEFAHPLDVIGNTFDGIEATSYYWDNGPTEWDIDWVFAGAPQSFFFAFGQHGAMNLYYGDASSEISYNYINGVEIPATAAFGTGFGIALGITARITFAGSWLIHHNRVTDVTNNDASLTGSVTAFRTQNTVMYHNSVRLTGASDATLVSTGLNQSGAGAVLNNAFSNEMTGGATANKRAINVVGAGIADYNALYSTGRYVSGLTSISAAVAAGVNNNGTFGPVSFDADLHITGGTSSAKQIGKPKVIQANDIDTTPIDTTTAGTRDAGADQFSPAGTFLASDVMPTSIPTPPSGGVPVGVPQTPTVVVKNNSQTPASFNVALTVSPGGYSQTVAVSLTGGQAKTVSFPSWTPVSATPHTFTAISLLGGDAVVANDTFSRSQTVSAVGTPPATYTFNASAEGWEPSIDWVRSSTFTKLGGPNGGSGFSWVTQRPTNAASYTEGAYATSQGYATTYPGANILMSPWLNISGANFTGDSLYISFQQSIETEPLWDRSWIQYTVDGITWTDLGVLNDPNGLNWYNEALYEHAAMDAVNFDEATMALYGLAIPPASWTSNDDGVTGAPGSQTPVGPSGYVYVQLRVTETSHPALVHSPNVRFRYIAFSDAVAAFGGWAFDNFSLNDSAQVFPGGNITGHAWSDVNANGVDDGEADYTSTKVYISLFGSVVDSTLTDGFGDYNWTGVSLPAAYALQLNVSGVAYTVPFGVSGVQTVNHPATGGTLTADFGTFVGGVVGKVYNDVNDNGNDDAEPGLAGWTVTVTRDSVNGPVMGTSVSAIGTGNWGVLLPAYAGNYYAKRTGQADYRLTEPLGPAPDSISWQFQVTGGFPSVTGQDFGEFHFGEFRLTLNVDINGNGTKDGPDVLALPAGAFSQFIMAKNAVPIDTVIMGSGNDIFDFDSLDIGTYTMTELDSVPGWVRTKGGVRTFIVSASGQSVIENYLDFKYILISGTKYHDINGNGAQDLGEPGLAGWTINVSGGAYQGATSAVTDVNGNYSIDSVFNGGPHLLSETPQAGWTQTSASPAGISGNSGNTHTDTAKNFGNFNNSDISGVVYRDYNGNGTKDPEDVVVSGVTLDLASGGSDASDGSGYSFTGVITVDTVRINVPVGFTVTQPAGAEYAVSLLSNGAAVNQDFGLFQTNDSTAKYRTFTADQLSGDGEKKPGKKPKAGKAYDPVKNKPNTGNLVDALINPKTGFFPNGVVVGLPGQLNVGGKTKAFVVPNKQGALWASLNNKGNKHDGMARGFDVDVKGKPFLKLQKAFAPGKKQDNKLFGELLALKLNLLASGVSTPSGLGTLIYSDASSDFDGWTIDEIALYADTVMTNFEFMPLGIYSALDSIAGKINGAFYYNSTEDTVNGWQSPVLTWGAYTSVYEVSFLKPNPGATPKTRRIVEPDRVPTAFELSQNYPNPFNPTTTIEFDLPEASIVTLKVYNLLGQEVATLMNKEEVEFSETVQFDASSLPSGVYLYRIVAETIADADAGIAAETFTQMKKMVLVK